LLKEDPIRNMLRASVGRPVQEQTVHGLLSAESGGHMDPSEVDIHMLAEKVKAAHGEHVYTFALQRALAIASGNSIRTSEALTNDGVLAAVRTELMKLLRPE
jgi:hypothetical protein